MHVRQWAVWILIVSAVLIGQVTPGSATRKLDRKNNNNDKKASAQISRRSSSSSSVNSRETSPSPPAESMSPEDKRQRQESLKAFESSLLAMFGMKTRPRPSRNLQIPEYMKDIYRNYQEEGDLRSLRNQVRGRGFSTANTVRSFHHDEKKNVANPMEPQIHVLMFNVSTMPTHEDVTDADLRVFRESVLLTGSYKCRIEVSEIIQPATAHMDAISRLLDVRVVDVRNSSWESFDVQPAVLKWRKRPHLNYGLEIRVIPLGSSPSTSHEQQSVHSHVRLRRSSVSLDTNSWQSQRPLLVVYSDDGRKPRTKTRTRRSSRKSRSSRKRRRPRGRRRKQRKNLCRRHQLYVDFSDVGWNDWIVAPPGYQAFYCHGDCPFYLPDSTNTTNHAIVQSLVNSANPTAVPTACCVPTELSPISMLYVDEYDKVVLKNYQDMVVEGCGCR